MKLIISIIDSNNEADLIKCLNKNNFMVTKLASTGGFLKVGNTTLMIGVEKARVDDAIDIIKKICKTQERTMSTFMHADPSVGVITPYPINGIVGGATIFVVDIDQFEKI